MPDTYSHGHHESVLRSHVWRTAENSAAYLLPHLRPGLDLLDVGCGPGTITLELAALVRPGRVVGVDAAPTAVAEAERHERDHGGSDVTFQVGDVYGLGFPDAYFDVVHAHQVLQHLSDPARALRSMRRVLRPGGLVAVRDGDYGAMVWSAADPRLDRWLALYHELTARNGAEADAGRYLLGWVQRAGFVDVAASNSAWTFATPEERAWWGGRALVVLEAVVGGLRRLQRPVLAEPMVTVGRDLLDHEVLAHRQVDDRRGDIQRVGTLGDERAHLPGP